MVTPWVVSGGKDGKIDYDKLIQRVRLPFSYDFRIQVHLVVWMREDFTRDATKVILHSLWFVYSY